LAVGERKGYRGNESVCRAAWLATLEVAAILVARFSVHRIVDSDQLVIDLQSNLLDDLKTRIVAPLRLASLVTYSLTRLHVGVDVSGIRYFVAADLLAAIPCRELGPVIGDLSPRSDEIMAAVDFAFQGF
jgi:toxin CcdB